MADELTDEEPDENQLAYWIVEQATEEHEEPTEDDEGPPPSETNGP